MDKPFWLNDMQWEEIKPLLPRLDGKLRVNNRRVISGIFYRFQEDCAGRRSRPNTESDPGNGITGTGS